MQIACQDIIKASFRKIGVLAKSENASADEMNDAMQALNIMIDAWATKSLMSLTNVVELFPLVANQKVYTIGVGGNFNTSKPVSIESAAYQDNTGTWLPLDIVSREVFDGYQDQDMTSAPPQALFYDPGVTQQAVQTGKISLYFTPDTSSPYTLKINSNKPFTEFVNLSDSVTFPPSYYAALLWNLALELYPEYWGPDKPIPPLISERALETMDDVMSMNAIPVVAGLDLPGVKGGFNIYTGDYNS